MMHKFSYNWTLKNATFTKDKGSVFSCFSCGGGSTMGYKLAGYDVVGCNEIDPRMMAAYQSNHHPKYAFLEPIQTFKNKENLPPELYTLDILDGSPPCSSFSMAGAREDGWGKKKHFREGQAEQVLDTLFFDFIDLAKRLQPKVVVAENVKGLLLGNARNYVIRINEAFSEAGYVPQHFLLNSSTMGVPQKRERVFFICLRKDLVPQVPCGHTLFDTFPKLDLSFNEPPILFSACSDGKGREVTATTSRRRWEAREYGDGSMGDVSLRTEGKVSDFNTLFVYSDRVCPTMTGKECSLVLFDKPRYLSRYEVCNVATFPQDYDFAGNNPSYICGMSVPPVMMAQVASRIYDNWLSRL